jgi:hypothetical protein
MEIMGKVYNTAIFLLKQLSLEELQRFNCFPKQLIAGILEDSNLKRFGTMIFIWTTLILLYDFSINLGDTFKGYYYQSTVELIDSVQLLNGEWRKRWVLDQCFGAMNHGLKASDLPMV